MAVADRRRNLGRVGLSLAILASLVLVGPPARGGYTAQMQLSPPSGPAGSSVTVNGSGHTMNAGYDVEIHWLEEDGPLLALTALDADGEYQVSITIPSGTGPGTYRIVACQVSFGDYCDPTYEFHIGSEANFTVTPPATTTTTTTTTSTTTTTIPDAPAPSPPDDVDTSEFISLIGGLREGFFGPAFSPFPGLTASIFIPRCTPPDGAEIHDFDADWVGLRPTLADHPAILSISGQVTAPAAGTITAPNGVLPPHFVDSPARHVVTFRDRQSYVGVFIGDSTAAGGIIELIGYDAVGAVVGVDRVDGVGPRVDTCMAIGVVGDPAISRVELRAGSGSTLAFDRLFYSAAGPLPLPPRPDRGTVEFIRPTDLQELSTLSRQLVSGTIRIPDGFAIDQVTLSLPNWDGSGVDSRHIDFYPMGVRDGQQRYLFLAGGVFVPVGPSWLTLTATGPGILATGGVEVIGVGPVLVRDAAAVGRVDIEPVTMEVTQAIRGFVDLILPGTTISERDDTVLVQNKMTVVRGFARLQFPGGEAFSGSLPVNARLVGTRNGVALPSSPLSPTQATTPLRVWADRAASYHNNKQETHLSWNFVLPNSWTDVGSIDLRLEVNQPGLPGYIDEADGYDGALNRIGLDDVTFRSKRAPAVNIWLVDYWFRCGPESVDGDSDTFRAEEGFSPTPAESFCMGRSEGDIVNAQPTTADARNAVRISWSMAPFPGAFPGTFSTWEYTYAVDGVPESSYGSGPNVTPGSPQEGFWLGVAFRMDLIVGVDGYNTLNALMSSFVRGKAWGSPSFFRTTPNPTTFIHEAAHTMGLRHTGHGHNEEFWVARWSGDHGEIDFDRERVSAWDPISMQALPYRGRHDYMSYGGARWTSWAVWHHVEDAVGSGFARPDNRADEEFGRLIDEAFGDTPASDAEVVTVSGSLTDAGIELMDGFHLPGGVVTERGDLEIQTLDAGGNLLWSTTTQLFTAFDGEEDGASFLAPILVPPDATDIVFLRDGIEVARRQIVPPPGAVNLTAPTVWPDDGPVTLSWQPDGGADMYRIEASRDGETWTLIATTDQTSIEIASGRLPFQGAGWRLRVQASTGLALAISPEVVVDFPVRPPTPEIALPSDGAIVSENTLLDLYAAVSSFSAGGEDEFAWSIDGTEVARGPSAQVVAPEPGGHEVSLTNPSTGETDTVTVLVVSDADLDGIADEWETAHGLDPTDPADAALDSDGDGLPAWQEFATGASPDSADTDGDGYDDPIEVAVGTDPADPDSIPGAWLDGGPAPRSAIDLAPQGSKSFPTMVVIVAALVVLGGGAALLLLRRR
jgi:hypothetical protein